jgi:hypothetical protein
VVTQETDKKTFKDLLFLPRHFPNTISSDRKDGSEAWNTALEEKVVRSVGFGAAAAASSISSWR